MRIAPPKSAFATMSDLILAVSQLEKQPEPLVDPTFRRRLTQAEAELRLAVSALDQAKTSKRHAAKARRDQGGLMIRSVRDFHQNLRRSAKREPAAQVWLEKFSLKQALPSYNSLTAIWYEQARQIAEAGEALSAMLTADPQAFPVPLPNSPSPAEVAGTLTRALATHQSYTQACATLKQAEAVARSASGQGRHLLAMLRKRLAALFHELKPEQRRVEMVKYGVRYVNATATAKADDEQAQVLALDQIPAESTPAPSPQLLDQRNRTIRSGRSAVWTPRRARLAGRSQSCRFPGSLFRPSPGPGPTSCASPSTPPTKCRHCSPPSTSCSATIEHRPPA